MSASRPLFIAACLILALLIGGAALTRAPENGTVLTTGKALVGGPFKLTDQHGRTVRDSDFRGKYCCGLRLHLLSGRLSGELQVMSAALDQLGPDAENIQPLFITIDPARDTPQVMKDYVSNFNPRLVGLTGSRSIAAVAASIASITRKRRVANRATDYLMDHSSYIYLMGPGRKFVSTSPIEQTPKLWLTQSARPSNSYRVDNVNKSDQRLVASNPATCWFLRRGIPRPRAGAL